MNRRSVLVMMLAGMAVAGAVLAGCKHDTPYDPSGGKKVEEKYRGTYTFPDYDEDSLWVPEIKISEDKLQLKTDGITFSDGYLAWTEGSDLYLYHTTDKSTWKSGSFSGSSPITFTFAEVDVGSPFFNVMQKQVDKGYIKD